MVLLQADDILNIRGADEFERAAMKIFRLQSGASGDEGVCPPYRDYLDAVGISPESVSCVREIPYLPIELFKTHKIYSGTDEPEAVFTSSSTGGGGESRHYVARLADYDETCARGFEMFYGDPADWSIYALLPSYLERGGSSLVRMADRLIARGRDSGCSGTKNTKRGGFYLYDHERLLEDMAADGGRKLLLGVSYALLDLAEMLAGKDEKLPGAATGETVVMETGGMKGRREEMSKERMHEILQQTLGTGKIHSEYGMAELMSQAWSCGEGVFRTPPWMGVAVRDLADPFDVRRVDPFDVEHAAVTGGDASCEKKLRGGINIIDLANLHSCAFIQTQDIGTLMPDGDFTVDGRVARSDVRGCNLLVQ